MFIHLIRHGKTKGNFEKRYTGSTDEALADETLAALTIYPDETIQKIWCSPLLRCHQTAEILFPEHSIAIVNDLRECHFGDFENKNHQELNDLPEYKAWIDGKIPVPNGEDSNNFKKRCCSSFQEIITNSIEQDLQTIAIVTHGGTIMTIMEAFALPKDPFYAWQPPNNGGFIVQVAKKLWQEKNKVNFIRKINPNHLEK